MAKNIIKEIIIVLLLCLAIILILGVLLYDYVPSNKVIPEKVSYTTPQNVKEELSKAESIDESQVVLTYEVDATDLNNYKRVSDYVPGKQNPFSSYEKEEKTENTTENGNTTSGNSTTSNKTNTTNSKNTVNNTSSEGTYLPNKGTK